MQKHSFADYRYSVLDSGCWSWDQCRDSNGYGIAKYRGVRQRAHRIFYQIAGGVIPEGMVLHHWCGNPWCVNPDHCSPVTNHENIRFGRRCQLTPDQVRYIRSSSLSHPELGRMFGVHGQTIYAVRKRISWKDIE